MKRKIELDVDGIGRGTLKIDGQDWSSRARKLTLSIEAGKPTLCTIECDAIDIGLAADDIDVTVVHEAPRRWWRFWREDAWGP